MPGDDDGSHDAAAHGQAMRGCFCLLIGLCLLALVIYAIVRTFL